MNYNAINQKDELFFILGPCAIESKEHTLFMAEEINNICQKLGVKFIFKSSFDKANRTSVNSKRGVGMKEGLDVLAEIKSKFNIPITTDVHVADHCLEVAKVADILQIPAFLSRQTDLLIAAAKTDAIINVKKAQFSAPWDMKSVIEKIKSTSNNKIILTERGTSFGYNNLVVDMISLPVMSNLGVPVIFDGTHSTQLPSGNGASSSGRSDMILPLAKAAVATGFVDGVFLEVHDDPANAMCDQDCQLKLSKLEETLKSLVCVFNAS